MVAAGFLSQYLSGPLPYVRRHITINKSVSGPNVVDSYIYTYIHTVERAPLYNGHLPITATLKSPSAFPSLFDLCRTATCPTRHMKSELVLAAQKIVIKTKKNPQKTPTKKPKYSRHI